MRLRPHHLLCMLTFVGEGYSPAFVANYRRLAGRLSAGEPIEIVSGPDDICAPLLSDEDAHCFGASVAGRDAAALADIARLLGRELRIGAVIASDPALFEQLRRAFSAGVTRHACTGCEWSSLCDRIAGEDYKGALVMTFSPPETAKETSAPHLA
ncbi:2Fe-2S ferredoxin [Neorhizobium galegae bv. orientalis str. HAMBI 540]|uniref:2Fe-2S ferredoxin n=1 Tax=Neorhizobium galegae bv. orientalis str. HAMBI 540 TaxID=1028800 RepID=A0A068SLT0_NEOGA|nr:2Fe-2S ferredoxin [Neorhizobium galegae bv. orientalis str. HAMBI 540]